MKPKLSCKTILEEFNGICYLFTIIFIISENHIWETVDAYPFRELYFIMVSQDNGNHATLKTSLMKTQDIFHGISKHIAVL